MSEILFINACTRPESRSLYLAKHIISKIKGNIKTLNLYDEDLKPLDNKALNLRDEAIKNNDFSNDIYKYAKDFANADYIVIAAPYWDLSFPSILKVYIENIAVNSITFKYSEEGIPVGLCNAKKLYYVTTSGGPIGNFDFGYEYIKGVSQVLFNISYVKAFKAENLDIYGADINGILNNAINDINQEFNN